TGAGHLDRAADLHGQALVLFGELGHRNSEAWAMDGLGMVETLRGRYDQAAGHHQQALTLFRDQGDRHGEAWAPNRLPQTAPPAPASPLPPTPEALPPPPRAVSLDQQARAHAGLARAQHAAGDVTGALTHYTQAAEIYTDIGLTPAADRLRTELAELSRTPV